MHYRILFVISLFVLFLFPLVGLAHTDTVLISVFERSDCKHCQDLRSFLTQYSKDNSNVTVEYIDVYDKKGRELFNTFTSAFKLSKVTPIILVGDTILIGFDTEETTGERIKKIVEQSYGKESYSFKEYLQKSFDTPQIAKEESVCEDGNTCAITGEVGLSTVRIPFLGVIDLKKYSLVFLAVLLGFVDGFNPCAMWVLVMFLTLLLQAGSRGRMFKIAGLFILAETIMYYLIMTFWITTWDFIGLDRIVTPLVGFVAIGAGIFFLYEYRKYKGTCKVVNVEEKKKLQTKIQRLVNSPLTLVGILGILGIAFSVNVIEFACSIGIPQTFTKVLDINNLSWLSKQAYTLVYILFYMIDDFVVFAGALYAFSKLNLATKYSQISNLIGGILMLILGILLIFARDVLMF